MQIDKHLLENDNVSESGSLLSEERGAIHSMGEISRLLYGGKKKATLIK